MYVYSAGNRIKQTLYIMWGIVCKAICSKNAIVKINKNGIYIPEIDMNQCVECGLCYKLCHGRGVDYIECYKKNHLAVPEDLYVGDYIEIINAKTKDSDILRNAVSGGVVTQLIKKMLESKEYMCAFLVDTYNYLNEVKANKFCLGDNIIKTTKSRYIPVSHENTVRHMLEYPDDKIIIVATSCCVHGILNVISQYKLKRENYLIIGLFCDKTMSNNVYSYFSEHPSCEKKLNNLYFRTKDAGEWPGNVRLEYANREYTDIPNTERMKVKEYYMLEKCLYCLDKLNQFADISVGDNYTKDTIETVGSSSVIIRTAKGKVAYDLTRDCFEYNTTTMEKIKVAQSLNVRKQNSAYIMLRNTEFLIKPFEEVSIEGEVCKKYKNILNKIAIGSQGSYEKVARDIKKQNMLVKKILRKVEAIWRIF